MNLAVPAGILSDDTYNGSTLEMSTAIMQSALLRELSQLIAQAEICGEITVSYNDRGIDAAWLAQWNEYRLQGLAQLEDMVERRLPEITEDVALLKKIWLGGRKNDT
jgi:hypothetical protein